MKKSTKTIKGTLDNWSIVDRLFSPYMALELSILAVRGSIVESGRSVVTSAIVSMDKETVETQNSVYFLGEVDPNYIKFLDSKGYTLESQIARANNAYKAQQAKMTNGKEKYNEEYLCEFKDSENV